MTTIGIDASSLISGGARTHIYEILRQVDPRELGVDEVVLWGSQRLIQSLEPQPWLKFRTSPWLERGLLARTFWKSWILPGEARTCGCRLLYIPAGDGSGKHLPTVVMSRNILPFMPKELDRYGIFSKEWLKLSLLRYTQLSSFRKSQGVIFLTEQARETISKWGGPLAPSTVIAHGVSSHFRLPVRNHRDFSDFSTQAPARIVNIGPVEPAKHQWLLVEAVQILLQRGIPVHLDLVGAVVYKSSQMRLLRALDKARPGSVTCHGQVPHSRLPEFLADSDVFCFTSSCENFPNTLLEGMASRAPVVALRQSPMLDILQDAAGYFDELSPDCIADALEMMLRDTSWRVRCSQEARHIADQYHWENCARATFCYLAECARERIAGPK